MKLDLEQNIYRETEIKDIIKLNIELDKIDINSEYKSIKKEIKNKKIRKTKY